MLSQKHRLSKSAEVKKTTARGRSFFNPYFVLKQSPGADDPRFTVIVSTKVSKKAVERNKIKRVIREELRGHITNVKSGDYVILVKSSAAKINSKDLRTAIARSLVDSRLVPSNTAMK